MQAQHLGVKGTKSTLPPSSRPTTKRKLEAYEDLDEKPKPKKARKVKAEGEEPEEKRLKRFRAKAPISYIERLDRVRTQRMFLIDRNRTTSADGTHEEEVFDIAGSTGK